MSKYRTPRKFNIVSVFMLAIVAAGGYWMWVFFPVYWDAFTVDHLLREGASALYRLSQLKEPDRSAQMRALLIKVKSDAVRLAHITDPDFDVSLDLDGDNVKMRCEYTVVVHHPIGAYTTVLQIKREEAANVKKVQWD